MLDAPGHRWNFWLKFLDNWTEIFLGADIDAEIGDNVVAARCRPLSKTKNFVIIQKIKENESNKK